MSLLGPIRSVPPPVRSGDAAICQTNPIPFSDTVPPPVFAGGAMPYLPNEPNPIPGHSTGDREYTTSIVYERTYQSL
jgi:hypothetical protein